MKLLLSFIKFRIQQFIFMSRRKKVFFAAIFAGCLGIIPILMLGGIQAGEILDSKAFCISCHDVHYSEDITHQVSPHSEVSCASCHVGTGTENLVKSKIRGLTDIIPAITHNYERPIPTPLKERRPSSETCEKCHMADKFFGDVPRITVTYDRDESNTRSVVTRVMKVGGGKREVSAGIHWHSANKVWFLPLDDQRLKIGWVASEDASGKVVEYIDPNRANEITPERIQAQKRRMDCVDCHNRATHIYRSPDKLIDMALAEGSIDVKLPYVKREALRVLDPQNESLNSAYDKVEAIREFYRDSYPGVFLEKEASINAMVKKVSEIARLTTFPDNLNWNTYPDHALHDKPDADSQIDWETISRRDESPGCFRCHGNLVKAGDNGGTNLDEVLRGISFSRFSNGLNTSPTTPGSAGTNGNGLSHTSPKDHAPNGTDTNGSGTSGESLKKISLNTTGPGIATLIETKVNNNATSAGNVEKVPRVITPAEGAMKAECATCHYTPKDPFTSPLAPAVSHPVDGLDDCLICHNLSGPKPFKADHPWSTNGACGSCHQSAPKLKTLTSDAPREAKQITHSIKKLDECLTCHAPSAAKPFDKEHPWATDDTCIACHIQASALKPLPPASPPSKAKETPHSTDKLEDCLTCHSPTETKSFGKEHPWTTNDTCASLP